MVVVPNKPYSPAPATPAADRTVELDINRRNTAYFIAQNPVAVSLTPRARVRTPSGGTDRQLGAERPMQTFRLIQQSPSGASIEQRADEGSTERRVDFVLLALWDAEIDLGDFWDDGDMRYEVMSILPYNGYETRANVEATGRHP